MGIRDRPAAARSPWQNGHAESLLGSIRRVCLDHLIVFGVFHRYIFAGTLKEGRVSAMALIKMRC
jgi:hypothetical protein